MPENEQKGESIVRAKMDVPSEIRAGVLKKKEQSDLENTIVDTLKNLNARLTKKEILSLMHRIEVASGLDGLRKELEKEKKLENTDITDETLRVIFELFHEVERVAESGLEELKLELSRLNESKDYEIDPLVYPTNKFPWIKRLEESELGKNIVIDIAWMLVGGLDSVHAILKFLLTLIRDIVLLPRDIIEHVQMYKTEDVQMYKTEDVTPNTKKPQDEVFILDEDEKSA